MHSQVNILHVPLNTSLSKDEIILLSLPNWSGVRKKASANFKLGFLSASTVGKCRFCQFNV